MAVVHLPPCCDRCTVVLRVHLQIQEETKDCVSIPDVSGCSWIDQNGKRHIRVADLNGCSSNRSFYEESIELFERSKSLLHQQGATFQDVVRTWIYLRDMENDYDALNLARRNFFERENVTLFPASTAVGGSPLSDSSRCSMSLYAISPGGTKTVDDSYGVSALRSATFNEAYDYDSWFSRGLEVREDKDVTIYLSGTAAIGPQGESCGQGELRVQVKKMLDNLRGLLQSSGTSDSCIAQAVSYLKPGVILEDYLECLKECGFNVVPHTFVHAEICRPELLCEMELLAQR